jgi:hypothetical protein
MSGISLEKFEFITESKEMPKGKYLVTDPCYVIGEDPFWANMIDWMFEGHTMKHNQFFVKANEKHLLFLFNTAYGDGEYPVKKNGSEVGSCGVDAGMLSLVPMDFVEEFGLDTSLGTVIEVAHNDTPYYEDGDTSFGPYQILTSDEAWECDRCGETGLALNHNNYCYNCQAEIEEEEAEHERELEELYG